MPPRLVVPTQQRLGPRSQRGGGVRTPIRAYPAGDGPLSHARPPADLPVNLLPYVSQAMEIGEDWVPDFQVSAADRTTSVALDGSSSLAVTVTTAEGVIRYPNVGTDGVPVTPGQTYTAMVWVRCETDSNWYAVIRGIAWDSGGAGVGVSGNTVVDPIGQSTWQVLTNTFTAPAGAAYAGIALNFGNIADGTVIYVDRAGLFEGSHGEDFFSYSGAPQTLEVSATATASGSVEASGVKSLAATATATASGSAAVSRVASLAAAATATAAGSADDNKIATLAATASATGAGSATASGVKPLAAAATATGGATGAISRVASIEATATASGGATAAVSRTATLAASATVTATGSADMSVSSGAVSIEASSTATASATTDVVRVVSVAAEATVTGTGSAGVSATKSLAATGTTVGTAVAGVSRVASLTASAGAVADGSTSLSQVRSLAASAVVVAAGSANVSRLILLDASGSAAAAATTGNSRVAHLDVTADVVASGMAGQFSRIRRTWNGPEVRQEIGRPYKLYWAAREAGLTLLRIDGQWVGKRYVYPEDLAAADRVFDAGREETIDETEYNELVAAGYGAYVTEEVT